MTAPAFAEEPATLSDRIDRVDEVIYGSAQSGSLINRVDNADNLIYGNGNTSASGLDNRITNLYTDVVKMMMTRPHPWRLRSMPWNII